MNSSKQPAKEISTDAISSFVYGTIQMTLAVIVVVLFWYFSSKLGELAGAISHDIPQKLNSCIADGTTTCGYFKSAPAPAATPAPATVTEHMINGKEVIFIFVSNILSFLGIWSGISALIDIVKSDKIGTNLAALGLSSSVMCLGLTVALTWLVELPL